jgi:hypothetical protein
MILNVGTLVLPLLDAEQGSWSYHGRHGWYWLLVLVVVVGGSSFHICGGKLEESGAIVSSSVEKARLARDFSSRLSSLRSS